MLESASPVLRMQVHARARARACSYANAAAGAASERRGLSPAPSKVGSEVNSGTRHHTCCQRCRGNARPGGARTDTAKGSNLAATCETTHRAPLGK
eukprot:6179625-Pleurochrysis_carterae.AAC.2